MPSKRTNDSVDRILEDLNIQQAQAGLRDSVTDRQVDEILRSVGITTAPAQPVPDRSPASGADGGLDALLQQPAAAVQPSAVFACPHCGKEYKTEKGLADHIAKEHADAPVPGEE